MLENDLIEAIIALPVDLFYNTGIATYIWVLSKNKRPERKGKIQLIDASSFFKKLRKALGDKKNEISPEDRTAITRLYADFEENEFCKIYPNEEFIYREYVVMQPLQRSYTITEERIEAMLAKGVLLVRPLREFCVSVFRQNQEYHVINVHDEGLFPLVTFLPEGWDGMRAGTA